MRQMKDPVVPLVRALYGHPDAGGHWENHCEERVRRCGFIPIGENMEWKSCFWNPDTRMLLTIYVDDFKLAGPEGNIAETWTQLREHLLLTEPEPVDQYLGCKHRKRWSL